MQDRIPHRVESVSKSTLRDFLARRPHSVVHVDAEWDNYRVKVEKKIRSIEPHFEQAVSFGYLDCDMEQECAAEIGIRNVPSVAYYKGATLYGVVIGVKQDIAGNIERMKRGEPLDQENALRGG